MPASAGHSGPRREAGKLLAVAEKFAQHCSGIAKVDQDALLRRLGEIGVGAPNAGENTAVGEYRAEYLAEFDEAIRQNGIDAFCDAAFAAFGKGEARLLKK